MWIFGDVTDSIVTQQTSDTAAGQLKLEKANVDWFPQHRRQEHYLTKQKPGGKRTFRSLTINGEGFEFSDGFTELHTVSYEEILKARASGWKK